MTATAPSSVDRPSMTLTVWRHHAAELSDLPGVGGTVVWPDSDPSDGGSASDTAGTLVADGVRRAALPGVVDLTDLGAATTTARALAIVRDLTSHGVVIDWRLRLVGGTRTIGADESTWGAAGWRLFNHLYPPEQVFAGPASDAIRAAWRDSFFLCRCIHRHGPGFVQIRDRRLGSLHRFTVDDPEYMAAIRTLTPGAPASAVPEHVLGDFRAEGLVWTAGSLALWLPYRVRRWPWHAMTV